MDLPPALTLDQLRNAVQAEPIDTVLLALTDMQGRLQGKRLTAAPLPRRRARARRRGLQLPARRRRRDEHRRRLRDVLVGARLRRLRDERRTSRRCGRVPWHEGTALCLADLHWADGEPVVASPRQILRAQLERLAERGLEAFAGTELEFIVFRDTYEEAFEKGYRDLKPANLYNVDYSLLGGGADRAADPPDPQRDGRGRAGGRELQGRVQRRPARDQLPLRAGAADRRRALDLQDGRQGDRRPGEAWRSRSWPSTTQREGIVVPHPHVAAAHGRTPLFAADPRPSSAGRRPARLPARADAVLRAERQLLQALRERLASRRPRSPGGTTTAPARCASSATGTRGASSCACRAPTSTRTWRWRR